MSGVNRSKVRRRARGNQQVMHHACITLRGVIGWVPPAHIHPSERGTGRRGAQRRPGPQPCCRQAEAAAAGRGAGQGAGSTRRERSSRRGGARACECGALLSLFSETPPQSRRALGKRREQARGPATQADGCMAGRPSLLAIASGDALGGLVVPPAPVPVSWGAAHGPPRRRQVPSCPVPGRFIRQARPGAVGPPGVFPTFYYCRE